MKTRFYRKFWPFMWLIPIPLIIGAWRDIPLSEILVTFSRLKTWQIFTLLLVNLILVGLFSMRWWLFLRSYGFVVPYSSLVVYRLAGFGLSYFTPGPQFGGEPWQVHLLHHRRRIPAVIAVLTVSLDKLVELLSNFSFLAFGIFVIGSMNILTGSQTLLMVIGVVCLLSLPLVYLWTIWRGYRPVTSLLTSLRMLLCRKGDFERFHRLILSAEENLSYFCKKRFELLLLTYGFSLLVWILSVLEYILSASFLGFPLRMEQAVVALSAARLAFLLPFPGGLGTLELSQVLAVKVLDFPPTFGASIALLIRFRDVIFASMGILLGSWLSCPRASKMVPSMQVRE